MSKVLILNKNIPKLNKIYTNLSEFLLTNKDAFKKTIIKDNPIQDYENHMVIKDNPINNYNNLLDIFESWDNTLYFEYKKKTKEKHLELSKKLDSLEKNKITIITCIRNNLFLLKDSISSLIVQSGEANDKWINLIINDGSDEEIDLEKIFGDDFALVKPYLNRIIIVNNKEWKGIVGCQLQAMSLVNTEFVGNLDSDDSLHPDCLQKVFDKYNEYKDEDIFVNTSFCYTDNNFNKIRDGFTKKPEKGLLYDGFILAFRSFRLKDYLKTLGYNPKFRYGGEDMDILYKLESVAKPILIDEELYLYRRFTNDNNPPDKIHLSLSRFHRYNCKMARIVNGIERYGNYFWIKIYDKIIPKDISENETTKYRQIYNYFYNCRRPFNCKYRNFYVGLYLGKNAELSIDTLKSGTPNDFNINHFYNKFLSTRVHKYRVNIKYSHSHNNFIIVNNEIPFEIDSILELHINNLYDAIYIDEIDQTYNSFAELDIIREFGIRVDNDVDKMDNNYNNDLKDYIETETDEDDQSGYSDEI